MLAMLFGFTVYAGWLFCLYRLSVLAFQTAHADYPSWLCWLIRYAIYASVLPKLALWLCHLCWLALVAFLDGYLCWLCSLAGSADYAG
jgi:hypothetical protein